MSEANIRVTITATDNVSSVLAQLGEQCRLTARGIDRVAAAVREMEGSYRRLTRGMIAASYRRRAEAYVRLAHRHPWTVWRAMRYAFIAAWLEATT